MILEDSRGQVNLAVFTPPHTHDQGPQGQGLWGQGPHGQGPLVCIGRKMPPSPNSDKYYPCPTLTLTLTNTTMTL